MRAVLVAGLKVLVAFVRLSPWGHDELLLSIHAAIRCTAAGMNSWVTSTSRASVRSSSR